MSTMMLGAEVAAAMKEKLLLEVAALTERGIVPCLCIRTAGKYHAGGI